MATAAKGVKAIQSVWSSGSLVFYEGAVGRTATGDVLTIGTSAVKVGGTAQDVDLQYYGTGSLSAIIDCGAATFNTVGIAHNINTSGSPLTYVAGTPGFTMYATAAGAGSTSLEPFLVKSTVTGTSPVGGRSKFHCYCNVAAGGWLNSLKGYMEFGASGSVTGLGSAICAEVVFPAATYSGTYGVLEAEAYVPASCVCSSSVTSFLYANVDGNATAITSFNTYGYFCQLGSGIADTTNGLLDGITSDATPVFEYRLRIKALGVDMYIPVSTNATFAG